MRECKLFINNIYYKIRCTERDDSRISYICIEKSLLNDLG